MTKITKDTFPKVKPAPKMHPLLASLPPHLKDPDNYDKIRKVILESLAGKCSHGEVVEWAQCAECQRRFRDKGQVLKKLGFTSTAQYMVWQQIHNMVKERIILDKYNT